MSVHTLRLKWMSKPVLPGMLAIRGLATICLKINKKM